MSDARPAATALALATFIFSACGGAAAAPAATTSPSAPATATPSIGARPTTAAPPASTVAGAVSWSLVADKSRISVRVREQLARLPAPSDAVLATTLSGAFTLNPDGSFAASSRLTGDVAGLKSDSGLRDGFVKQTVLESAKFPTAIFVPTKTSGLTTPLAVAGEFSFKLSGRLTIHGVEKEVTFDVKAKRAGTELTATASLNPTVKFGDFGMAPPSAASVLSVVDEIRMDIELSGNEAK